MMPAGAEVLPAEDGSTTNSGYTAGSITLTTRLTISSASDWNR
jgi:hypothetical protein